MDVPAHDEARHPRATGRKDDTPQTHADGAGSDTLPDHNGNHNLHLHPHPPVGDHYHHHQSGHQDERHMPYPHQGPMVMMPHLGEVGGPAPAPVPQMFQAYLTPYPQERGRYPRGGGAEPMQHRAVHPRSGIHAPDLHSSHDVVGVGVGGGDADGDGVVPHSACASAVEYHPFYHPVEYPHPPYPGPPLSAVAATMYEGEVGPPTPLLSPSPEVAEAVAAAAAAAALVAVAAADEDRWYILEAEARIRNVEAELFRMLRKYKKMKRERERDRESYRGGYDYDPRPAKRQQQHSLREVLPLWGGGGGPPPRAGCDRDRQGSVAVQGHPVSPAGGGGGGEVPHAQHTPHPPHTTPWGASSPYPPLFHPADPPHGAAAPPLGVDVAAAPDQPPNHDAPDQGTGAGATPPAGSSTSTSLSPQPGSAPGAWAAAGFHDAAMPPPRRKGPPPTAMLPVHYPYPAHDAAAAAAAVEGGGCGDTAGAAAYAAIAVPLGGGGDGARAAHAPMQAGAPPPPESPLSGCPDVDLRVDPFDGKAIGDRLRTYILRALKKRAISDADSTKVVGYARKHRRHFFWVHDAWRHALANTPEPRHKRAVWQLFARIAELDEYSTPLVRGVWEFELPGLVEAHMDFTDPQDRAKYTSLLEHWHTHQLVTADTAAAVYERAVRRCREAGGEELRIESLDGLLAVREAVAAAAADTANVSAPAEDAGSL